MTCGPVVSTSSYRGSGRLWLAKCREARCGTDKKNLIGQKNLSVSELEIVSGLLWLWKNFNVEEEVRRVKTWVHSIDGLVDEKLFPEMEKDRGTFLFQSQARGEAEVGRDDHLLEVLCVQHSEPGGVAAGLCGTEGERVVRGVVPSGAKCCASEIWVGGAVVMDGYGGFVHPHHCGQPKASIRFIPDGDEVAGDEGFVGETVVVGWWCIPCGPERPNVDQRSLEDAVGAVLRHLVRCAGKDAGDSARPSPRNNMLGTPACCKHLLVGRWDVDFHSVSDCKRCRHPMHV